MISITEIPIFDIVYNCTSPNCKVVDIDITITGNIDSSLITANIGAGLHPR